MQLIQPELKELQKRYKGDRARFSQAQMELYKERGVNPASGCLPLLLQLPLLLIIYQVISQGLTNPDPTAMFTVFGFKILDVQCVNGLGTAAYNAYKPCIDTTVGWLNNMDVSKPQVLFAVPLIGGFSILAFASAFLQLVQSRMTMPPSDPAYQDQNARMQRQLVLFLPLISILYGGFLPAGLFIYWIVTTIFGIAQQYLIVGWGSMFPVLGWTPEFAKDHRPRFPVESPALRAASPDERTPGKAAPPRPTTRTEADRTRSAASTVRPRERGRQGRRGRKR
jgi:YidC/Oxa1 family membrane protein insertase